MSEFFIYYLSIFNVIPNNDFLIEFGNNCKLIFPELFLVTSILILIIYGSLLSALRKFNFPLITRTIAWFTILILSFLCILLFNSYVFYHKNINFCTFGFNNTLIFDDVAIYLKMIVLIFSMICILIMHNHVLKHQINAFEYFILLLLAILGLLLLCSAFDLMTIYLAIELQSLSFYILAAFKRDSSYSTEAGLKYFILGSFSSGLLLFGFSFIYGYLGTTNLSDISQLLEYSGQHTVFPLHQLYSINFSELISTYFPTRFHAENFSSVVQIDNDRLLIILSMFFIASALFFKIAAAPYHMWSPDVYEGAPTSSTLFFALIPKIVLIVLFFRIFYYAFGDYSVYIKSIISVVAGLSVIVGSFTALKQRKIKRLFAYSSISHVGYVLMAVCTISNEGVNAVFFYLIIYMLTGIGIWSVILINEPNKPNTFIIRNISDLSGLINSNIMLTFSFIFILFSLAGIPPLAGFYAKLLVLFNAIKNEYFLLALVGVLTSTISAYYYLRIIKIMCFDKKITTNILFIHTIDYQKSFILGVSLFSLVFFFLETEFLNLICYKLSIWV